MGLSPNIAHHHGSSPATICSPMSTKLVPHRWCARLQWPEEGTCKFVLVRFAMRHNTSFLLCDEETNATKVCARKIAKMRKHDQERDAPKKDHLLSVLKFAEPHGSSLPFSSDISGAHGEMRLRGRCPRLLCPFRRWSASIEGRPRMSLRTRFVSSARNTGQWKVVASADPRIILGSAKLRIRLGICQGVVQRE